MQNKNLAKLLLVSAFAATMTTQLPSFSKGKGRYKECLHCNEPHNHHNDFCSPECCKAYATNHKKAPT